MSRAGTKAAVSLWYSRLHKKIYRLFIKGKNVFETLEVSNSMPNLISLCVEQNAVYWYTAYSEEWGRVGESVNTSLENRPSFLGTEIDSRVSAVAPTPGHATTHTVHTFLTYTTLHITKNTATLLMVRKGVV